MSLPGELDRLAAEGDARRAPAVQPSYLEHFDFLEPPFSPYPDARFAHGTASHSRGLATVINGHDKQRPLIVISGDEGVGKTTLCLALSKHVGPRARISVVLKPPETAENFLRQLLADFGVDDPGRSGKRAAALCGQDDQRVALRTFVASLDPVQGPARLVVDDAQDLPSGVWEEISLWSNGDANGGGPLQIVLVGRRHLEDVLRHHVPGSDQRVGCRHCLSSLAVDEVGQYIERRLWVARGGIATLSELTAPDRSARGNSIRFLRPRFSNAAVAVIAAASEGNPRIVNLICDRALEIARDRRTERVSGRHAKQAAAALGLTRKSVWRRAAQAAAVVGALAASTLLVVSLQGRWRTRPALAGRARAPAAQVEPMPAAPKPLSDTSFEAFRSSVLQQATALSAEPDVKGLLKLEDELRVWDNESKHTDPRAVDALLVEVRKSTDAARRRQLDLDRRELLKSSQPP